MIPGFRRQDRSFLREFGDALMTILNRLSRGLEIVLEAITAFLVVALTAVVVYSVLWRYIGGASPRWYDEIAAIMLVWLTYYAGALAALKRGHIGVDSVLLAMPPRWRMAVAIVAEAFVIGFFLVLCWMGLVVLEILQGMTLIALRWIPVTVTQSVIPIGAALFIIAQILSMPAYLARVRAGISQEQEEVEEAIAQTEEALAHADKTPERNDEVRQP
jgi:TRAP-type C4-dicarboxylate transport system permease small subunit